MNGENTMWVKQSNQMWEFVEWSEMKVRGFVGQIKVFVLKDWDRPKWK